MKLYFNITVFLFSFLGSSLSAFCQEEELSFSNYDIKQGISNSWVNSINEDSRGFLWLGTRYGLNCFSGSSFERFYHSKNDTTSLSSNDISTVNPLLSGKMAIGTWGGGINLFDPLSKKNQRLVDTLGSSIFKIRSIHQTKDSLLWIGTYGRGFFSYDLAKKKFEKCSYLGSDSADFNYCNKIHEFRDTIWVVTVPGGLAYIDKKTKTVVKKNIINPSNAYGKITSLSDDGKNLVCGTLSGHLFKINTSTNRLFGEIRLKAPFKTPRIDNIQLDEKKHKIWVLTSNGVYLYDIRTGVVATVVNKENNKTFNHTFSSFKDSRGLMWIGSWGAGIYKHVEENYVFKKLGHSGFNNNSITSISAVDDNNLFIGTESGTYLFDGTSDVVLKPSYLGFKHDVLSNAHVTGMVDFKGKMLVSHKNYGYALLDTNYVFEEFDYETNLDLTGDKLLGSYIASKTETWLFSSKYGVLNVNQNEKSIKVHREFLKSGIKDIYTTFVDMDGVLWIGTKRGVHIYDPKKKEFIIDPFSESSNKSEKSLIETHAITQDLHRNMWISSFGGLICYSINDRQFLELPRENNNFHMVFYNTIIFNNELWCTSDNGLIKINIDTKETFSYTTMEGLVSNSFPKVGAESTSNRNIFLVNGNKVLSFHPKDSKAHEFENKLFLKSIEVNNEIVSTEELYKTHVSELKEIELEYEQNNIVIDLDVVNFNDNYTYNMLYAHKLKGFDKTWVNHDFRDIKIKYANLDPGNYTLEYTTISNGLPITKNSKFLNITILPPFWETWWFFISVLVFGLVIIYLIRQSAIRKRKFLEQKVAERTSELVSINSELKQRDEALNSNMQYASLIQESVLSNESEISKIFKDHFVFYKPRDVVSGDFFLSFKEGNQKIFIVADCTGHGVSGAFLSILGVSALKSIVEVNKILRPDLILNALNDEITKVFKKSKTHNLRDGMDISVISFNQETNILKVAAALQSPYLVNSKEDFKIKGDRFPIGGGKDLYTHKTNYTLETREITEPTTIFLYSDGFPDQFGEKQDRKYMQKNFRDFLRGNTHLSLSDQLKKLDAEFSSWKGNRAQIDDVLVVGLRVNPQ